VKTAIAVASAGKLKAPALGSGIGGQRPSTRDFRIVDQDQSDNVVSTYLLNGAVLSQNIFAASTVAKNTTVLAKGSDNGLLVKFIDPALECTPWQVSSPTAPNGMTTALALNDLQASAQLPTAGAARVSLNDPRKIIGTATSIEKTNLYRAAVSQLLAKTAADASSTTYCKSFMNAGIFIQGNKQLFTGKQSPAPDVAVYLYTFFAQRFAASPGPANLGCLALLILYNLSP
jgi:hypothetical protein